jgi:hypothetical protein
MSCSMCGAEDNLFSTDNPVTGETVEFCTLCASRDLSWEVDDWGNRFPRVFNVPRFLAYDGESVRNLSGERSVFDTDAGRSEVFECGYCNHTFYNSSVYITDSEDTYCQYCADTYAAWDENSENYYTSEDEFPDAEERAASHPRIGCTSPGGYTNYLGVATDRFLATPTVGIEFEHAPVQERGCASDYGTLYQTITKDRFGEDIRWDALFTLHTDGSISTMTHHCSSEIVSFPASGNILNAIIDRFYEPFANGEFTPGPEHHSCGFHMHVASLYLDKIKCGKQDNNPTSRRLAKESLQHMANICMEFISSTRKKSDFCNGNPAVRDKNTNLPGSSVMYDIFGMGGYPAIAVRTHGTLEYRMWPSSNSIKNTKARAELSQKLTAYWDQSQINHEGGFEVNREMVDNLKRISSLCIGGERSRVVYELKDILSLSPQTVETLAALSEKFNPFSAKKTYFKFSDHQIGCIRQEDSGASEDFIKPEGGTVTHVGDTTAYVVGDISKTGGYLTFGEVIKCYPANSTGKMPELVAALAKGDL